MQINIKFVMLLIVVITNLLTYKVTMDKLNFKHFSEDIAFSLNILKMLDNEDCDNQTKYTKHFLAYDINRLFYEAGKTNDLNSFSTVCKYLTVENLKIINRYSMDINDKNISNGKNNIINFCKTTNQNGGK
jgi:hypothetical protein